MRFTSFAAAALSVATVASAASFQVEVGKDGANVFAPTSVTGVQAGDTITFRFTSKNHTATQSTFDKPCEAKAGGVDSGFRPVPAGATTFPEWTIKIENVTTPHWFYCNRVPHCSGSGMVFAINPTEQRSFDLFQRIAKGEATPPPPAAGGAGGAPPAATTPAAGATPSGTPAVGGDPSAANGTGAPATNPPVGAASSLSSHIAATALAALGLIASLTL